MNITRQGHTFDVVDLKDEWGFWQRFADGRWEPELLDMVAKLAPGRTFLDIGAWVGAVSLWAQAHGASRVVAVECDPIALPMLHENLPDTTIVERAVWVHNGEIAMNPDGNSTTRVGEGEHAAQCVRLSVLWQLCHLTDALVKIDIEGAETPVLDLDADTLLDNECELILSLHPWGGVPDIMSDMRWKHERVDDWTWHLWPSG